jgi:hypothetical protein
MKDAAYTNGLSKVIAALILISTFTFFIRGDVVLRHARAAVATVNELLD